MAYRDASPARAGEDTITTLYAGALGRLESVQCRGKRRGRGSSTNAPRFHIVLPLSGSFMWHPGREEIFADTTKALFAGVGEDYAISHPAGGDRSLVIWPNLSAMEELTRGGGSVWKRRHGPAARARRSSYEIQLLQRVLISACTRTDNLLAIEEILLRLLVRLTADGADTGEFGHCGTSRTLARAKAVLQARSSNRQTLTEIAHAVGVSPVYLTQLFRAAEGIPLYQYSLKLRMGSALDELERSEDITRLAIDLGFSSHSHFSAAFRTRYGASPSAVRTMLRVAPSRESGTARRAPEIRPLCPVRGGMP